MDKKNNMKQAMYEMFGVGSDVNAKSAQPAKEKPEVKTAAQPIKEESKPRPIEQPVKKAADKIPPAPVEKPAASFLAPGTVFEGPSALRVMLRSPAASRGTFPRRGLLFCVPIFTAT